MVGDVPYIAYVEGNATGGVSRVKKRNIDGTWSQVGTNNPFGSTQVTYPRIFNDKTGKVYIGAVDKTGGLLSVAVLGANDEWIRSSVSTNSVAYTGPSETRFDISFDSNNIPYIAYSERVGTTSGYPWVKRLVNGIWETVGQGAVQQTDLYASAVDVGLDSDNVPYLVYISQVYNATSPSPVRVYRYSSANWESITPPSPVVSSSTLTARYSSITMDSENNPIVCYFNSSNSNKSTTIRYNKTTALWDSPTVLSTRDASNLYLINDSAGNLYNIFTDALIGNGLSSTVRVFKKANGSGTFNELENIPTTSPSGVGIDATGENSTVARTTKIATLSIAVGNDTSKPYIIYTKTNSTGVVTPIVQFFSRLVSTKPVTNINYTSATTGGEVASDGLSTIIERGIVYSTGANPTITANKVIDVSTGPGSFTTIISGLLSDTGYNVRAYSINSNNVVSYGNNETFSTPISDPTNVRIIDNGTTVVMNNGIVKATINKTNGSVTSLIYNGLEMIQGGYGGGLIYWSWNMPAYQNPEGCTYSLVTDPGVNNFNSAEIKLHMSWNGNSATAAMDVDVYYSLQRNVSGLYAAAVLSHPAAYPALAGGEWRMASYPNPRLDWLSVDALRNKIMPSKFDVDNAVAVTGAPPEVTRLTTGIYKDKYECKYDYSADLGKIDTWGWSSTVDNVGLYVTAPSKEYYSGGPEHTELMCHANPVMLNMLGGTHFGYGQETAVAAGEEWQKNYGPFLLYCNKVAAGTTNAQMVLWQDAKTQAKIEQTAWPYEWHNNPAYIKQNGRGTVIGKLTINDSGNPSASAANTWVGLGIPPAGSNDNTQFQRWSKNYQFWVKTDSNGNFTIPDVIPGTYTLFAYGPGARGQLTIPNYATVTAGQNTTLGTVNWEPTRVAKTVWELGIPDRDTKEFKHGSDWWTSNTSPDLRWGIFLNYPDEFPNDVNFTIGESNISTDWNFVQYWDKTIRASSPAWNINFNLDNNPTSGSIASVYVALAEMKGANLILNVNGTNVTNPLTGVYFAENSNAMIRKGTHGTFNDTRFNFPAELLKKGANQITFTIRVGGSATLGNVMFDYVRLEANLEKHLSVESFKNSQLVKVFPNPTNNIVNVTVPDNITLEKIIVYNNLGQLVTTEFKNIVSLEKFNSGCYHFLIVTSQGNYFKTVLKI
ncbi:hypothetical protein B0A65_18160 [Flavobacterium frigidimaris]|uniref:rhamnogalacturonan endolyase n=1 Tax=Flavobacterium frigidimaris TaxID=262320 RepID=A0ABX4BLM9_FLAFR|nr:hypothetical protein B0A65_18160 [Flavobacterium frigidimaris]